jgi:hypothetical protein
MALDASGNLGLGVTPSAWSTGTAFQGSGGNLWFRGAANGVSFDYNMAFYSGAYNYLETGYASRYYQVNGAHVWYSAPSGTAGNAITFTQTMILNASGNLGIGETSPADMLDVKGNARVGQGQVVATSTVGAVGIYSGISSGSGNAQLKFFGKSVDNTGLTYELGRISGGSFGAYGIDGGLSFSTALNNGSNVLTLSERMRLDASGNLLVASTISSPPTAGGFSITQSGQGAGTPAILRWNKSASGNYYAAQFMHNGSIVGSIEVSNTATAFVTSSDYRLKENIVPMTGALEKVAQLKPCNYTWKVDGSSGQGFIAHELQSVVPDAVMGEKDAVNEDGSIKPQGIDTSFLVATLTAAIKEQQAIITTLTARITALESA